MQILIRPVNRILKADTVEKERIFKHRRGSKEWIIIISIAVILHLAFFLLLKPEYLEIFRSESPGNEGDSDYLDENRVFALIHYPDEVIIPELDQHTPAEDIEPEKPSVFDELGEPEMNIQPVTGGRRSGGESGSSGTIRHTVEPKPLFIPWPKYPEGVKKGVTGKVELLLYVDEKGEVRQVKVSRGLPQKVFNDTAVEAAREIRFIPGAVKGVPTPMWIKFTIGFQPR
ncbi:MAG: energy transducer TonB [Candidatus Krumholzibacteriota bacterium]|nr:energy transducer TonB [Candidatus Krumholzibacteriota bacterium]